MASKESIVIHLARIGLPPKPLLLTLSENEVVKSLATCPVWHSHFIAEECRLQPFTVELLLRYARLNDDKTIEDCALALGLIKSGGWLEPYSRMEMDYDTWLAELPAEAQQILHKIKAEFEAWQYKQLS